MPPRSLKSSRVGKLSVIWPLRLQFGCPGRPPGPETDNIAHTPKWRYGKRSGLKNRAGGYFKGDWDSVETYFVAEKSLEYRGIAWIRAEYVCKMFAKNLPE